jgi:hypothetical protein
MKLLMSLMRLLKTFAVIALTIWFITWFVKGLFHPKWWWVFWLWLILSLVNYATYESTWPK